jgi:hypothetical protein
LGPKLHDVLYTIHASIMYTQLKPEYLIIYSRGGVTPFLRRGWGWGTPVGVTGGGPRVAHLAPSWGLFDFLAHVHVLLCYELT